MSFLHLKAAGCEPPCVCDPPCPDPLPDAAPVDRMQAGGFNWRGDEGSITDRVAEEQREHGNPDELRHSAYTRPSTGLVYMQARYYEPQTGRFTQADRVPYGVESILQGQNNRWAYCANDPVNCSDPSGQISFFGGFKVFAGALIMIGGIALLFLGPAGIVPGFAAIAGGLAMILDAIADETTDCTLALRLHAIAALLNGMAAAILVSGMLGAGFFAAIAMALGVVGAAVRGGDALNDLLTNDLPANGVPPGGLWPF